MIRIVTSLFFLFFCSALFAQNKAIDSLYVSIIDGRAMVIHEVKKDESLYSIAQIYSVPALVLSQNNDVPFYEKLEAKRKLYIPMGNYNYLKNPLNKNASSKPIYYKVQSKDTYLKLSNALTISEEQLIDFNKGIELKNNLNSTLLMGWILYQTSQADIVGGLIETVHSVEMAPTTSKLEKDDTNNDPPSDLELIYNYQTQDEVFLDSANGMIVFFKPQSTVNNKLLYAFSNELSKGRVVKIINPSNQKFVFAKIIGPLPTTKQYLNAKIGLDGRARAELGTREIKLWCDFKFKY